MQLKVHNGNIEFELETFPFFRHEEWIKQFAHSIEGNHQITISEYEYSGDTSGCCINFENSVFILRINELIELAWIEPSSVDECKLDRLYRVLLATLKRS